MPLKVNVKKCQPEANLIGGNTYFNKGENKNVCLNLQGISIFARFFQTPSQTLLLQVDKNITYLTGNSQEKYQNLSILFGSFSSRTMPEVSRLSLLSQSISPQGADFIGIWIDLFWSQK